jgi:hypothetical protein
MGSLIIRPGTLDDVDKVQKIANEPKSTLSYLGGFTMREYLVGMYGRGNESQPNNIVAELDGEVVGFSDSKGRHHHYHEYDLVAVIPELRRKRIGTALYAYHAMRCGLSGRMFARDQTIHFNTLMVDGYLPFHEFEKKIEFRHKIRNFSTIFWWIKDFSPESIQDFINKAEDTEYKVEFVLEDRKRYEENLNTVLQILQEKGDRSTDIRRITDNRDFVLGLLK